MKKIFYYLLLILYLPFFIVFFLLLKFARLILAIAYAGMFDFRKAGDILKNMFDRYGSRRY